MVRRSAVSRSRSSATRHAGRGGRREARGGARGLDHRRSLGRRGRRRRAAHLRGPGLHQGRVVGRRQRDGERAPAAGLAGDADLAAQQPHQFPRDREAQPGPAELPARGPVRLPERLEDDFLLVRRDADPRVADGERDPVAGAALHVHAHLAGFGELQRVREQVFEHLLQPLPVGGDRVGAARRDPDVERQGLLFGDRAEHAVQVLDELREPHRLGPHVHAPGLDLRQVEDVVDEREQVVPGGLNGLGVPHLFGRQVPLAVVREELRQDERGVQRRAQLVRHVGQEVGLVPAGQLEFPGLHLKGAPGLGGRVPLVREQLRLLLQARVRLLEFGLLLFEPALRLAERPPLFLEFLVRDAQLLALGLELLGLPLGLFEQVLQVRAVPRGPDRDPDRLRGAVEQLRRVRGRRSEEPEFEHRVDSAIRSGRDDGEVPRVALTECGAHSEVIGGHVVNDERAAVLDGPADQPVVRLDALGGAAGRYAVRRDAPEPGALLSEERAGVGPEVLAQPLEYVVAEVLDSLVPRQRRPESDLPHLEPLLLPTGPDRPAHQVGDGPG
ncbi:hypothetical protein FTUN_6673 [Frigoriglobus tundricola]|uniref:Uncharacterized protein n=1 Tax=Frigoriglobus tundricola TaxID=2774151 RepID=A0A6M5YYP2_9BACT|nr:hypothetical protein FTUN_6673 [Frigoriglobus tundricola]